MCIRDRVIFYPLIPVGLFGGTEIDGVSHILRLGQHRTDRKAVPVLSLIHIFFEELKCCAVSNIPRKISNIVELMKLAALVEDFPPKADRIHRCV